MDFIAKFIVWLIASAITLGVIAYFSTVTWPIVAIVALVWAVIIWGGILILDDLDF